MTRGAEPFHSTSTSPPNWAIARGPIGQSRDWKNLGRCASLHVLWLARMAEAMMAILDGRFTAAEALAGEALHLGRRTHGTEVEGLYGMQMFTIRREQSRLSEVAPAIKHFIEEIRTNPPGCRVLHWSRSIWVIVTQRNAG